MFILRELLRPLQAHFSDTALGQERAALFAYTLLAIIVPFTSSMTSNCLRCLETLFGIVIKKKRFYTFMASATLPWQKLWQTTWGLIPTPKTDGRVVVAVDDYINPKVGQNIFACDTLFDHAAKANQSQYPWAQNVVSVGLLKRIKGRWACLFLDFRFYLALKTITAQKATAIIKGRVLPFQTKLAQAGQMLIGIGQSFSDAPLLAVMDSWFGNDSLYKPVRQVLGDRFNLLSRLRSNALLSAPPEPATSGQRGRRRKYGQRLGSASELAVTFRASACSYLVDLYGKQRDVLAYSEIVMLRTLKCRVRVVWVFRKTQWVALFTTDLDLSVSQIIEYYGARWKIEAAFKELKQDIGSRTCQCRNAQAVINHLHLCMMASTLTWIYADRLKTDPQRRHKVKGRTSFAFSDVRRLIAEAALDEDFARVCPKPGNPPKNPLVAVLLRMVA